MLNLEYNDSPQTDLSFPTSLAEKYRPTKVSDFIGLEKPRKIVEKFSANPKSCAFLFVGPSGTGKTSLALAMCEAVKGELIHIASQHCTVAELEEALRMTAYVPMAGKKFWFVLVDEADQMTEKAQLALLSKLDATGFPRQTIFVFTCNSIERLEARFLSRCMQIEFSSYGMSEDITSFLEHVWHAEGGSADCPDLKRLAKETRNNVRDCLMRLEVELLAS
jgi:replication factor C subunit 2/4